MVDTLGTLGGTNATTYDGPYVAIRTSKSHDVRLRAADLFDDLRPFLGDMTGFLLRLLAETLLCGERLLALSREEC